MSWANRRPIAQIGLKVGGEAADKAGLGAPTPQSGKVKATRLEAAL